MSAVVVHCLERSEGVTDSIGLIAEGSEVTASSSQNVSAATEEQLASMEEIASSTALAKMAKQLQYMIGKFKV